MLGTTTIKPYNNGYVFVFLFWKLDRGGNGPVVERCRHCLNMVQNRILGVFERHFLQAVKDAYWPDKLQNVHITDDIQL